MKFSKIAVVLMCSLCFASFCSAQDSKEKLDAKMLVGEWMFEAGERAGVAVGKERLGTVTVSDKEFTIPVPGAESFVMAYTIDSEKSPAHIELEITAGPGPASKSMGIIAISDGKIKLCYDPANAERPESFETSEDDGFHYFEIGKSGDSKISAESLEGTWTYEEGKKNGEAVRAESIAGEVVFSKTDITIPAGDQKFVMQFKLDDSKDPVHIDMEIAEGPGVGQPALGLVKMEGDLLWLCYRPGEDRPDSFESTADNGCFVFKMKKKEESKSDDN